jgi:hypothetical protein
VLNLKPDGARQCRPTSGVRPATNAGDQQLTPLQEMILASFSGLTKAANGQLRRRDLTRAPSTPFMGQ